MADIIKPDETTAARKRVFFSIFDTDGLITDAEAFAAGKPWAVNTFAPGAGDLKVGADNGAAANYGGTFAYRKDGEWYYEFSNAEVAASLGADTVYSSFVKAGYRSVVLRIPLRYDLESVKDNTITAAAVADGTIDAATFAAGAITAAVIATDAIDADALKADAVTEIQSGLATSAALAVVQADTDDIQARLPAALVAGKMDSTETVLEGRLTALRAGYLDNLSAGAAALEATAQAIKTIVSYLAAINLRFARVDNTAFSTKKMLTACRVRVFASEAAKEAATDGHADGADGEIYRLHFNGTDPGTGLASAFRFVENLAP